jgi:hypothetical protein
MSPEMNLDRTPPAADPVPGTSATAAPAASVAETVKSLADDARSGAAEAAESGKDAVAGQLDDVARAVHRSGEQLEGHQDWMAQLVERGADQLGSLATTLRTNDLQGLFGRIEQMAQRQPALFVGAAMAAGFATARLGKVAVAGASAADLPKMPEVTRD